MLVSHMLPRARIGGVRGGGLVRIICEFRDLQKVTEDGVTHTLQVMEWWGGRWTIICEFGDIWNFHTVQMQASLGYYAKSITGEELWQYEANNPGCK